MSAHHGITENQWFEYLEDLLPGAERARVEAHLRECEECRELYFGIRAWEDVVQNEARILVSALDRDPDEIEELASRALEQIRKNEPRRASNADFQFGERVLLIRGLIDPLCGRGAAQNAVRLAMEQSCMPGQSAFAAADWGLFVRNLGAAIGTVYGVPVRALIERVGYLVEAGDR